MQGVNTLVRIRWENILIIVNVYLAELASMISCPLRNIPVKSDLSAWKTLKELGRYGEIAPAFVGQFGPNITQTYQAALQELGFLEVYGGVEYEYRRTVEASYRKMIYRELPFY